MELCRISLVNWHLFDREDIEVAGHIGILGENRSGKSTLLDLIQTVFTGANRTYLRLNAKAGEAGGRRGAGPRRSVHGYCLGMLGEGEMRRNEARTYLMLGFADPAGLQRPVTIGLALEARSTEPVEDVIGRFVVTGALLSSADFVESDETGDYASDWSTVKARIAAKVGPDDFVNHRERAIAFVREYLRRLVPSLPAAEQHAVAFQKAVVNAATLGQDVTATDFVRRFIIDDNSIRVADLRDSIATYRSVSATIEALLRKLETLTTIHRDVLRYREALDAKAVEDWVVKRARWLAARAATRVHCMTIAIAERHTADNDVEMRDLAETLGEAKREVERLDRAIAEQDARTGRVAAEQLKVQIAQRLNATSRDLASRKRAIDAGAAALAGFPAEAARPIVELTSALRDGEPDPTALRASEAAARARIESLRAEADRQRSEAAVRAAKIRAELETIAPSAGGSIAGPRAHLDEHTRRLLARLESAGMAPRVLCDVLEIADEAWTAAAEGLLGRAREVVFVERSDMRTATELFRAHRREFPRAQLVSVAKLERFRDPPSPGTFASLFVSEDADAIAFLQSRYGNIRLAETLEAFDRPGRALMKDGFYDDGLVRGYRVVDPATYKIGKAAQAAATLLRRERAERLRDALTEAEAGLRALSPIEEVLRALSAEETIADLLATRAELLAEIARQDERIAAAESASDGGLRDRKRGQIQLRDDAQKRIDALRNRNYEHDRLRRNAQADLGAGEERPGSRAGLSIARRLWRTAKPLCAYRTAATAYRERLAAIRGSVEARPGDGYAETGDLQREAECHRQIGKWAEAEAERRDRAMREAERTARAALHGYFAEFPSTSVGAESPIVAEILPWMEESIADMEENELRHYREQASDAAQRASTLFRGEFVNQLNQRIGKMRRDLQALNAALRDHPFHNERYSFHSAVAAEYKAIVDVTQLSEEDLNLLFKAEIPEDSPHAETLRAVTELLTSPEQNPEAFEDYRQFFVFEIHMEDVETGRKTRWEVRRGIGSGAEQQVPLYVAIGASLASVYGSAGSRSRAAQNLFAPAARTDGIALTLFDEAFSKMDGKNQRQMMSFYEDLGLQVIIAAPMEKKAAIMGYMTTIVEVDRSGERSWTEVVTVKERAREALRAIDPERMDDAALRARLDQERGGAAAKSGEPGLAAE